MFDRLRAWLRGPIEKTSPTPRRKRQVVNYIRWRYRRDASRKEMRAYFSEAAKVANTVNEAICADAAKDIRDAVAHMLREYRKMRDEGLVTRFLDSISHLFDNDDARDYLQDPVVFHDLGILLDAEQTLEAAGDEQEGGFAFDVCSEGFHERMQLAIALADLILTDRRMRLVEKWDERRPEEGARVEAPQGIDRFPHFHYTGEMTGTVVHHGADFFVVKVDQHIQGCEEWDNEISYSDDWHNYWDEWVPLKESA